MKIHTYLSFIYSIIVFLSGVLAYRWADRAISLYIEVLLSILLFILTIFMIKEKTYIYLSAFLISCLLIVFYGYNFFISHAFFQMVLVMISFFMAVLYVNRFLKLKFK
jgi:uncharacterized membrane protein (UPF0136 family)